MTLWLHSDICRSHLQGLPSDMLSGIKPASPRSLAAATIAGSRTTGPPGLSTCGREGSMNCLADWMTIGSWKVLMTSLLTCESRIIFTTPTRKSVITCLFSSLATACQRSLFAAPLPTSSCRKKRSPCSQEIWRPLHKEMMLSTAVLKDSGAFHLQASPPRTRWKGPWRSHAA